MRKKASLWLPLVLLAVLGLIAGLTAGVVGSDTTLATEDTELGAAGSFHLGRPADTGPAAALSLRPGQCCISCNGISVCGFCVSTNCGSCCTY